ncbi:hypothetical protein [Lacticaseibacillus absianus]|uniref:hypothetical protein n=1 Tax=Lacticaseibacillus absianus TaxID=2729623 RepID=UPI0015C965A3|nr:hypothetical protein [Lacticaseibacillus absianus]
MGPLSGMSWLLILLAVVAAGAMTVVRRQLRFAARVKRAWQGLYLGGALLMGLFTGLTSQRPDDAISGGFIVVMLLVFASWRRGLTDAEVINGFGSMRPYTQFTQIQLQAVGSGTALNGLVGTVVVVRLQFTQSPAQLAQFLKRQMPPQRVVIL